MYNLGLALRCDLKMIIKLQIILHEVVSYLLNTVQEMAIPKVTIPINATPLPIPSIAAVFLKVGTAD